MPSAATVKAKSKPHVRKTRQMMIAPCRSVSDLTITVNPRMYSETHCGRCHGLGLMCSLCGLDTHGCKKANSHVYYPMLCADCGGMRFEVAATEIG